MTIENRKVQMQSYDSTTDSYKAAYPTTLVENITDSEGVPLKDLLGNGGSVDLDGYYTKEEVDAKDASITPFIKKWGEISDAVTSVTFPIADPIGDMGFVYYITESNQSRLGYISCREDNSVGVNGYMPNFGKDVIARFDNNTSSPDFSNTERINISFSSFSKAQGNHSLETNSRLFKERMEATGFEIKLVSATKPEITEVSNVVGTSAGVFNYIGVNGQLVVNSETKTIHIMDGKTTGGTALPSMSDISGKVDTSELDGYYTKEEVDAKDASITPFIKKWGEIPDDATNVIFPINHPVGDMQFFYFRNVENKSRLGYIDAQENNSVGVNGYMPGGANSGFIGRFDLDTASYDFQYATRSSYFANFIAGDGCHSFETNSRLFKERMEAAGIAMKLVSSTKPELTEVSNVSGTTTGISNYIGVNGQLVVNRDTKTVHIMDGKTAGGTALPSVSDLSGKVDAIEGKGLSSNDFTTELKTKLESITGSGEGGPAIDTSNFYTKKEIDDMMAISGTKHSVAEADWVLNEESGLYEYVLAHNGKLAIEGLDVTFYNGNDSAILSYTYVDVDSIKVFTDVVANIEVVIRSNGKAVVEPGRIFKYIIGQGKSINYVNHGNMIVLSGVVETNGNRELGVLHEDMVPSEDKILYCIADDVPTALYIGKNGTVIVREDRKWVSLDGVAYIK